MRILKETDLVVPEEPEVAAEGAAAAPRGAEFQDSVHRLLNAMRDLLGNLEPPEVPNENEAGPENQENQDEWEFD